MYGRLYITIISLLLVCALVGGAAEQKAPLTITARVNNDTVRVGDVFTYTVRIEWSKKVEVKGSEQRDQFGSFQVKKIHPPVDKKLDENRQARVYSFELTAYETGTLKIPAFDVVYIDSSGEERTASSLPVEVEVKSVLPADEENLDINPLKAPFWIEPDYRRLYLLLASVVLALLLISAGVYAWRRFVRKRAGTIALPSVPARPAEEIAREQLAALKESPLLSEGRIKEFYSRAADIVRAYLGHRYAIPALDMTSFELLDVLERRDGNNAPEAETMMIMSKFLEECDMVKFAKYIPPEDHYGMLIDRAFEIVERTTPRIEESSQEEVVASS